MQMKKLYWASGDLRRPISLAKKNKHILCFLERFGLFFFFPICQKDKGCLLSKGYLN